MTNTLDAMTFPLWGSRLIEASAGTGKTWTIAALYLRLVLGHGGDDGYSRPLVPSEILVMTFTRAATRELSDRIRSRLLEAARCFRGEAVPQSSDGLLIDLLAAYPEGACRSGAAWRLAMAAESMDDAAVHTIDAWCQRMLREHAFDSGCLFDEELTSNERAMQDEAAQDYWRQQFYPLSGELLDKALSVWKNIDALTDDARKLLDQSFPEQSGQGSLADLIKRSSDDRTLELCALKGGWSQRAKEMQAWIDQKMDEKPCVFDKRKLAPRHYTGWLTTLADWADDPQSDKLEMDKGADRFTPSWMHEAVKPGNAVVLPEHFELFEQLMQALEGLEPLSTKLRLHAAACIARRLSELKSQAGTFGFADMLNRLDAALNADSCGANAERLRARVLGQYPVALIDEFQDTSPVQSRIFDRLYRINANERTSALLLIGDPKQSIYGFRGADIYSYLTARRATEGRHYVLGTNHRSTTAVVAAVNHLFSNAEARLGAGAFLFRTEEENPDADANPLPFVEVEAKGRAESFVTSTGGCPALTLTLDSNLLDSKTSVRDFSDRCAEHIVTLLNDDRAGFDHPTEGFSRLRPADIAILVRTGREAAAIRRELRRRNVASVYLSDKDSVFDSDEASDLLHWLKAVAAPKDVRLARAALATRTVGLSIEELAILASDDEAFDSRSEQLRQLNSIWQGQGVLTMLRQTLHMLELPARWLGSTGETDGERRLTNFLHLAELLQVASAQLDGEQAMIRWLSNQVEGSSFASDDQIVRLESDADLVKVVTVHKSKGLEYPLVFLPFACGFRGVDKAKTSFVSLADSQGNRTLHLSPSDEQIAIADKDRHREDLRLLYVALTRARHALWVGVAALKVGNSPKCMAHRSSTGYLLCGAVPIAQDKLSGLIGDAVLPCVDIVLTQAEDQSQIGTTMLQERGTPTTLCEPAIYSASFERRWTIGSFSALVRDIVAPSMGLSAIYATRDDEAIVPIDYASVGRSLAMPAVDGQPWHSFPRGAMPGNFLHDQMEWLAGEGFDLNASPQLQQQLLRRCERQAWGHRGQDVLDWLIQVVKTPMPHVGAALSDIQNPLPEMEFWLPSEGLLSTQVDDLCRSHLLGKCQRPVLPERELRGMLMGFADLVFEHEGRYWVLDYKSNHLGPRDADYTNEVLEVAMASHRYDVQASLYMLALHRLLKSRLGSGYEPAQHLGGAIYFFLRGIQGPANGCYFVPPHIELLDELDALLCISGEIA